ncbi:MAG: hypothetical protein OXG56_10385 [Gammaproteobacteria bacterium]|nr:hypothetical protein [Gammaproteobacteria bacterium]
MPVLIHSVREGTVTRLVRIQSQDRAAECLVLPGDYTREPVPFVG